MRKSWIFASITWDRGPKMFRSWSRRKTTRTQKTLKCYIKNKECLEHVWAS